MDTIHNNILPVGGGFIGAMAAQVHTIENGLVPTIVFAFVGAVIGCIVKWGWDKYIVNF